MCFTRHKNCINFLTPCFCRTFQVFYSTLTCSQQFLPKQLAKKSYSFKDVYNEAFRNPITRRKSTFTRSDVEGHQNRDITGTFLLTKCFRHGRGNPRTHFNQLRKTTAKPRAEMSSATLGLRQLMEPIFTVPRSSQSGFLDCEFLIRCLLAEATLVLTFVP